MAEQRIEVTRNIAAEPGEIFSGSATRQGNWEGIEFPIIPESSLRATLGVLARTVAPGMGRPGAG